MLPILTLCIYLLLQFLILYFTPRILGKLPLILQIYSLLPQHNKDFLTTILLNILTTAAHIAVNQTGGFSYPFITFTSTTNAQWRCSMCLHFEEPINLRSSLFQRLFSFLNLIVFCFVEPFPAGQAENSMTRFLGSRLRLYFQKSQ